MSAPARLLIFDRSCRGRRFLPGLSHAWGAGRLLYEGLGRLDAGSGASSWAEALAWLRDFRPDRPIAEIQFWGHGNWGNARIGGEPLDWSALRPEHRHHPALKAIRERMRPGAEGAEGAEGLWWFRTCETFGTGVGQDFARAWTSFFGCRAAGYTHIIGVWQSGLHSLLPGQQPGWTVDEGLPAGLSAPTHALPSRPGAPNTISCFHGRIPAGF